MKTTPFTEKHIALGAKMHEFAGYNMPIEYSGIIDEHLTVCNAVGVFDVSHMGEFWVKGPQALAFLQKVTSNNVAALVPGKIQYTCFPNEEGGIVDDLLVYCYEPEKYRKRYSFRKFTAYSTASLGYPAFPSFSFIHFSVFPESFNK